MADSSLCPCKISLSINEENCQYRAEGNSSLVVRLRKEEKVLRLLKNETKQKGIVISSPDIHKRLELQVEFISKVMKPLLGNLVPLAVVVRLPCDDVRTINRTVESSRPLYRRSGRVQETSTSALLLPDYCAIPPELSIYRVTGPVLGIEIKPKQGYFLDFKNFLWDRPTKMQVCRYCLKQNYKWRKNGINKMSGYCPLHLFSGCPRRMHHALKELLKTPQNNLRIFKNQEVVFCEEKCSELPDVLRSFFNASRSEVEHLCQLVIQALRMPFPEAIVIPPVPKHTQPEFCDNTVRVQCSTTEGRQCRHHLPRDCILDRILRVQKLGNVDAASIYPFYLELVNFLAQENGHNSCQLHVVDSYPCRRLPEYLGKVDKQPSEALWTYVTRKIWEFLVALTAKDCSILLVMQRLASGSCDIPPHHVIHDLKGNPYLFSVTVIDLDAKPLSAVEKVYRDNCNMIQSYIAAL